VSRAHSPSINYDYHRGEDEHDPQVKSEVVRVSAIPVLSTTDWLSVRVGHNTGVRSGYASWPLVSLVVPATHPEGCDQHQHPERHGAGPDQPYEREYARPREHREEHTEDA
jgi:hypothetical protein